MKKQLGHATAMDASLLYVSTSLLPHGKERTGLANIVAVAQARNEALDVTGALVISRSRFAQVLEGPRPALDELMVSIRRDPRHRDVNLVDFSDIGERRFRGWSLAYVGPSTYLDQRIAPLLARLQEAQRRRAAVQSLMTVLQEFVGRP